MPKSSGKSQKWSLKPSPYFPRQPIAPQPEARAASARISKVSSEHSPPQPRSPYSDLSLEVIPGSKSSQRSNGKVVQEDVQLERVEETRHRAIAGPEDFGEERVTPKEMPRPQNAPLQIASKRKLQSIALSLCDSPMYGRPSLRHSRPSAVINTSTSKDNELRMGYLNEEFESFLDIRLPQLTRPSASTAERRVDQPSYESENDRNSQSELKNRGQLNSSRGSNASECSSHSRSPSSSRSDYAREVILPRVLHSAPLVVSDGLPFSAEHERLLEGINLTDFMKSGQQDANFGNRVLKCSQLEFEAIGEGNPELAARYAALIQKIIQGITRRAVSHAESANALGAHQVYLKERAEKIRATHERLQKEGDILCARVASVLPKPN